MKWVELDQATLRRYSIRSEVFAPGVFVRVDLGGVAGVVDQLLGALLAWRTGTRKRAG